MKCSLPWLRRFGLLSFSLMLTGCPQSVEVVTPPGGNPPPVQTNPVSFSVRFNARADTGTFRATLDPNPGYPTTGGTDITSAFQPNLTAGSQAIAVITVPHPCSQYPAGCVGEHRLRVEAQMNPSQAFDSTGEERVFRLQGVLPPSSQRPSGADFRIEVTPADQSAPWGANPTYGVRVRSLGGFNQPVTLSAVDLPDGSSARFSPARLTAPVNGSATATMTIAIIMRG
jgi:hypothetical protein